MTGLAERIRLSLRSPIRIAGQEIVLTGSIGIAIDDGTAESARDLLRDAAVAMHRAKRPATSSFPVRPNTASAGWSISMA